MIFFYICPPILSFASVVIKIMYVETFIINIIFVLSSPEISSRKGELTFSFSISFLIKRFLYLKHPHFLSLIHLLINIYAIQATKNRERKKKGGTCEKQLGKKRASTEGMKMHSTLLPRALHFAKHQQQTFS